MATGARRRSRQRAPLSGILVPLITPFQYDGTNNLMVDVSHNGTFVGGNVYATAKRQLSKRELVQYGLEND